MKLLINGAVGCIGLRLVKAAELNGYQVVTAGRGMLDL
jgi:nucleoside-diphosphate-sugar epimerase